MEDIITSVIIKSVKLIDYFRLRWESYFGQEKYWPITIEVENNDLVTLERLSIKGIFSLYLFLSTRDNDYEDYEDWCNSYGIPIEFHKGDILLSENLKKYELTIIENRIVLKEC